VPSTFTSSQQNYNYKQYTGETKEYYGNNKISKTQRIINIFKTKKARSRREYGNITK
jgi:hypothetical protein